MERRCQCRYFYIRHGRVKLQAKGPVQREPGSAFLMSRKELPLSRVDVESHESLDWERVR